MGVRILLTLACLGVASAQFLSRCSNYQTSRDFTQDFVDKMRTSPGGYLVRLSNGAQDQCQRLQFVDGNDFNLTFIDSNQRIQNHSDRYTVHTASLTKPATLRLTLVPRLIGADLTGHLSLYPLVVRDEMVAFASCFQQGLGIYMTEQILVLTPFASGNETTVEEMKAELAAEGVPRLNELLAVSTECSPNPNTTNSSPFNLANIMNTLGSPFQRIAAAQENQESPSVLGGMSQTLAYLRGEVFPAQWYAAGSNPTIVPTTSEVEVAPSVAAAEALNAFQKASGDSESDSTDEPVTEAME